MNSTYRIKDSVMKRIILILSFIFTGIYVFAQGKKFDRMIGRWEFMGEQGAGGTLEVIDSSTIMLTYMGEKRKIENLNIDFSKSPFWLDFTTKDTASTVNIKSLMEIVNDSLIKWQLFIDEPRTSHFTSNKGELFYLRKSNTTSPVLTSTGMQ
jgi:hypothetical protein